jgi:Delta3-Delta2-enoyl-CoA isomerase
MADSVVTREDRGRVAILTLNNPKKLNAMTQDQYYILAKHMRDIADDKNIYITVLTGTGRFFSA